MAMNSSSSTSIPANTPPNPDLLLPDGVTPPVLKCACDDPIATYTSHTTRNPGRRFLKCAKQVGGCKVWIWEELLHSYVQDMVAYSNHHATHLLHETISLLQEKICRVERLEDDIEKCNLVLSEKEEKLKACEDHRNELQELVQHQKKMLSFWKLAFSS